MRNDISAIKIISIFILVVMQTSVFLEQSFAQGDREIYSKAVRSVKEGEIDFAFMNFHWIRINHPESEYFKDALFATGEYYFSVGDYRNADECFNQFIDQFSKDRARIFASVYLLEIAKKETDVALIKSLTKEIFTSEQLSLLFRDYKEYYYISPLSKIYKATYFIDKVEFHIDGKLFTQVSY